MTILDVFFIFYRHRPEIRQKTEFCLKIPFSGQASMISNRFASPFAGYFLSLITKTCVEDFRVQEQKIIYTNIGIFQA
jgi:hypothetical protein